MKQHRWEFHPRVRSGDQLTLGERAADAMRNGMGSWGFVFGALIFLGIWMLYNGSKGFDPYPFILLNLVLSCVAALQGAILLIAAKRADQISAEMAKHHLEISETSKAMLQANTDLTQAVHDLVKQYEGDAVTKAATKAVDEALGKVAEQIKKRKV